MSALAVTKLVLQIILVVLSLLLTLLILMHKGKGGGLSDMFGGGLTQNAGSSGVAEKNLNRWTVIIALVWVAIVIALGLSFFVPKIFTAIAFDSGGVASGP